MEENIFEGSLEMDTPLHELDDTISNYHLTNREMAIVMYRAKLTAFRDVKEVLTSLEDLYFKKL